MPKLERIHARVHTVDVYLSPTLLTLPFEVDPVFFVDHGLNVLLFIDSFLTSVLHQEAVEC